jgi:Caspase domain
LRQNAPHLANPVHDADDVAAALKRIGFETILATDLDKDGMDKATIKFAKEARTADVAMFYYSGHALQFGGVNYLAPIDAKLTDEADLRRMVRVDQITEDLQQAKNLRLLVLDSCRNDPLADQLRRSIGATRALKLERGLAKIDAPLGMIVAYSTQAGTEAEDGEGRNSPYTAAFLKNIEARREIGTIFRRISDDVYEETKHSQLPELSLSITGEFYLNGKMEIQSDRGRADSADQNPPKLQGGVTFDGMLTPPESPKYIVIHDNALARAGPGSKYAGLFRVVERQQLEAVGEYENADEDVPLKYLLHRDAVQTWVRVKTSDGREGFLQRIDLLSPTQLKVWDDWQNRIRELSAYFDRALKSTGPFASFAGVYCPGKCLNVDGRSVILSTALLNRWLVWFEGNTMHRVNILNPATHFQYTIERPDELVGFGNAKKAPFKGVRGLRSYKVVGNKVGNRGVDYLAFSTSGMFYRLLDNGKKTKKFGYLARLDLTGERVRLFTDLLPAAKENYAMGQKIPSAG